MANRTVRALLAALAALLLWPALAFAETPAEYRQALAETARAAEAALSALPPNASLAEYAPLQQALVRLESITRVTSGPGESVAIDNRDLLSRLRGSRGDGGQAYESLRQLLATLDASAGRSDWMQGTPARGALDEVLARPDFRKGAPNPVTQFLQDLRTRLSAWIESLLPAFAIPLVPAGIFGAALSIVFWLVFGASAIFAIVFFALTWRSSRQSLARYAALHSSAAKDLEDSRAARLAARRAADQGDHRGAVHYLYLWAVLHLAEQSQLRYDRSLTNREQARSLGATGEVAELLRAAVDAFDRIWYGHAACTIAEYGQFRAIVERIVEPAA